MNRRRATLCLCLLGGASCDADSTEPVANVTHAPIPVAGAAQYRAAANPLNCPRDREGRFSTLGNRWARYADICIDRIELHFDAVPGSLVSYFIRSNRCPEAGDFSGSRLPDDLFEKAVPAQIQILKGAIAEDLRAFARRCGYAFDAAPFTDRRFDEFYVDYGDGWWFDRVDDGFRLTPDARPPAAIEAAR